MREIYMLSGNRCQEIHSPPRYGGMTGLEKSLLQTGSTAIF